jgi:transposase
MKELCITPTQHELLEKLIRRTTRSQQIIQRAQILLDYQRLGTCVGVAAARQVGRDTVAHWVARWKEAQDHLEQLEAEYQAGRITPLAYERDLQKLLADAARPGTPPKVSEAQKQQIIAVAAQRPEDVGIPVTQWSHQLLAQVVVARGIVPHISASQVGRFLKAGRLATTSKSVLGTSPH